METGGGASSAPSGSPGGGAVAAPSDASTASTSNPVESFASQLRQIATPNSPNSQPASDGNKTDGTANPTEGETGEKNAEDQGTTVTGEDDSTPSGEKGADTEWSPGELKALRAHGLDAMPFNAEAKKLLESNRELRSKFDQVSGSNANAIEEAEGLRQAVWSAANGDVKALQERFGVDLKLNQRTPDIILQEMQTEAEGYRSILQSQIEQAEAMGDTAGAHAILNAGNALLFKMDEKARVIRDEKKWQEREKAFLQKAGKAPEPENAFKALKGKAETNLTALTQEDPEAAKWFKEVEEATKPGGALRALGIDLPRAYGTNLATARKMNEIGKALALQKHLPQILNDSRKKWEAEYEKKKVFGGTNGKTGGSRGGDLGADPVISRLQSAMTSMARGGR